MNNSIFFWTFVSVYYRQTLLVILAFELLIDIVLTSSKMQLFMLSQTKINITVWCLILWLYGVYVINIPRATPCFQDLLNNGLTNNVVFSRAFIGFLFYSSRGHTETNVASAGNEWCKSNINNNVIKTILLCLENVWGFVKYLIVVFLQNNERFCKCCISLSKYSCLR